jgi:hypothetical protein
MCPENSKSRRYNPAFLRRHGLYDLQNWLEAAEEARKVLEDTSQAQ